MRVWLFCALLLGATIAVYCKLAGCDFVGYDDGDYFYQNPRVLSGLTVENVGWAFKATFASNWHPLTWLSHMLDAQIFGMRPGWAHFVNLLLHATNSVLLFLALRRMTKSFWRSGFVAALFALHPLHVESVAWISERKDVLSAFFFMLTLLAYARYVESRSSRPKATSNSPTEPRPLGSAPEPQAAAGSPSPRGEGWPALRRLCEGGGEGDRGGQLSAPRHAEADHVSRSTLHAPRFTAAAKSAAPALWYGAALFFFALGLMSKPMLVTLPFLLLLLDYWPLARADAHPRAFGKLLLEKLPFLTLTAVSCAVTFLAQARGGAVESLEHVPLQDRLANGVMAYAAYLWKMLWPSKLAILYLRPDFWPLWQIALCAIVLLACTALAIAFAKRWPYLAVGWLWYLGTLVPVIGLVQVGNQFMADRYTYLPLIGCFIIAAWGGWDLAQALGVHPRLAFALGTVPLIFCGAITFRQTAYWRDTETLFGHCLAVTKDNYVAHNILGAWLGPRGEFEDARAHFQAALRLAPGHADSLSNLGVLLAQHGDYEESLGYLREAVRLRPQRASVFAKLGLALDGKAPVDQVITFYREGLRAFPDDVQSCNNLAWLLATSAASKNRDGAEAVQLAERACTLTGFNQAPLLGTLAAAYAEATRFDDATQTAEKAIKLADAAGQTTLSERNRRLLELYRARKPFHEAQ